MNKNDKVQIMSVNGVLINVVKGHTIEEYLENYSAAYKDGALWDFSLDDAESGAITLCSNIVYWLINDRLYETE